MLGELSFLVRQLSEGAVSWINSPEKLAGCRFLPRGLSSSGGCSFRRALFRSDLLDTGALGVVEGVHGVGLRLSAIPPSGVSCLDSGIQSLGAICRLILRRLLLQRCRDHCLDSSSLLLCGFADLGDLTGCVACAFTCGVQGLAKPVDGGLGLIDGPGGPDLLQILAGLGRFVTHAIQ